MSYISKSLLVVIPAFNEENTIGQVVETLLEIGYKVLVVDDGSTDETYQVASNLGAAVLRLPLNLGVGGALRAGFQFALRNAYDTVIQIDADGQHPIHEIVNLVTKANQSDAHMVIGSRFKERKNHMEIGIFRRAVMYSMASIASRATGERLTDVTSGFRLIRAPLLASFASSFPCYYLGDTYEAVVVAGRAGYKIVEIPATITDRVYGTSSASKAQSIMFIVKAIVIVLLRLHPPINRVPIDS